VQVSGYVLDPSSLAAGNRATLLRNGSEAFPRMLDSIAAATHSIIVEMYTWAGDTTGWKFARAIADRAKAGIQVRILYDALGSQETPTDLWSHLRLAGAAVTPFRPAGWFGLRKRDHRKLVILDGRRAYVGGLNIADEYATEWRDTALELDGPIAAELLKLFQQTWEAEEDDPLWRPHPPPPASPAGSDLAGVFSGNRWLDRRSIAAAYVHAIKAAKKRIWISNAYFMPGLRFLRVLRKASRRGVDVRIFVPSRTDAWPVYHASRSLFAGILAAGIRIFEWQGPMMHAKTAVIDDTLCIVGSYNLDHLSLSRNLELTVLLDDPELGASMSAMFEADVAGSREILPDKWRRRGMKARLLEWFWRLFQSAL
jgi:cardiolipin synthase